MPSPSLPDPQGAPPPAPALGAGLSGRPCLRALGAGEACEWWGWGEHSSGKTGGEQALGRSCVWQGARAGPTGEHPQAPHTVHF